MRWDSVSWMPTATPDVLAREASNQPVNIELWGLRLWVFEGDSDSWISPSASCSRPLWHRVPEGGKLFTHGWFGRRFTRIVSFYYREDEF